MYRTKALKISVNFFQLSVKTEKAVKMHSALFAFILMWKMDHTRVLIQIIIHSTLKKLQHVRIISQNV